MESSNEAGPSRLTVSRVYEPASRDVTRNVDQTSLIHPGEVHLAEKNLDRDIALLVSEWLHSRSQQHTNLARSFDEELLGIGTSTHVSEESEAVERAITDGEWGQLESLVARPGLVRYQVQRAFLYMCYRQQFLEHIDNREFQKAFNLLQKRLKPLEHYQPFPYDFYNLCYLTSAGSVHDAPGLRDWGGSGPERGKLVAMWRDLIDSSGTSNRITTDAGRPRAPQGRLVELLRQAACWQVQNTQLKGQQPWTVTSLLSDYQVKSLPNRLKFRVTGHTANIKCVDYIGGDEHLAISGSSDSTLRIFDTMDGSTKRVLSGHRSRIWDCAVSPTTEGTIASGSGDGTVRIWSVESGDCLGILDGDCGDVYSVKWRPGKDNQLVSASYDRILRTWDVETQQHIRTFSGHTQSTLCVACDPSGNLLASGSKDKHIRLWDAVGGVCTYVVPACLGEITSLQFDSAGRYLLAGSKDNSIRLWDLRMQRHVYRYTGHQNTSKNFIRSSFAGPDDSLIISGSEDGNIYIWDRESATPSEDSTSRHMSTLSVSSPSQDLAFQKKPSPATSPAYYPVRERSTVRPTNVPVVNKVAGGINVKPVKVLEDQREGAVFDVKWCPGGEILGAGEDGSVGIWETTVNKEDDSA